MPAIVAPRISLPRGYPATPLVAPPDGARLSILARDAIGQVSVYRVPRTDVQPARREAAGKSVRLLARDAAVFHTQLLAHNTESDTSASLHQRANAAYIRMRDSHIQWVPGYERVDITV